MLLFFCSVTKQVQQLFPLIYGAGQSATDTKSGKAATDGGIKAKIRKNQFWDIVALEISKFRIFDTKNVVGLNAVDNARMYDVLKYFNLHLCNNE